MKKIAYEQHPAPKGYESKFCNVMEMLLLLLRQSAMEGNLECIDKFEELAQIMLPEDENNLILDFSAGKRSRNARRQ